MSIAAFGVPVFTAEGKSRSPVTILQDVNKKLASYNIPDENVISIQAEQDFYHVFYRTVKVE